jgi:hypothetical protein
MFTCNISISVLTWLLVGEPKTHVTNPSFNRNFYLAAKRPGNIWFHTNVYRKGKLRFSQGLNLRRFQADVSPSLPVGIKMYGSIHPPNHLIIIIVVVVIIVLLLLLLLLLLLSSSSSSSRYFLYAGYPHLYS